MVMIMVEVVVSGVGGDAIGEINSLFKSYFVGNTISSLRTNPTLFK